MKHFIIDFDSTFTKVEAFDLLGEIVLKGEKNKHKLAQIEEVTCKAMEGSMSLHQSLQLRISILNAHRNHLPLLIKKLHKQVSTSFIRNKIFIDKYKDHS